MNDVPCTLPVGTVDNNTCTGTAMACAPCGIDNQGYRPCTCTAAGVQDCGNCLAPTGAGCMVNTAATTCMAAGSTDGTDTLLDNTACTPAGRTCVPTNTTSSGGMRGCVCWDLDGAGLKWHCGSLNNWFAVAP